MGIIGTKTIYECDNCKKQSHWLSGWKHKIISNIDTMNDEIIIVCSEKCANEIDDKRRKEEG